MARTSTSRSIQTPTSFSFLLIGAIIRCAYSEADSSFFFTISDEEKLPYTMWLAGKASSYDHSVFLPTSADPTKGMATHWKVTGDNFNIAFATMAMGWASFGIAEAGGMFGADVVSFTTADPTTLVDGYILNDRQVLIDESQPQFLPLTTQNPRRDVKSQKARGVNHRALLDAVVQDGWIIVEATRPIDTQDTQDNVVKNDKELWRSPSRMISAWGDSEALSYHGDNRASSSVRIFADPSSAISDPETLFNIFTESSDGYFEVVQDEYEIPAKETTYVYVCKTYEELTEQFDNVNELTMVGVTPVITEETRQLCSGAAGGTGIKQSKLEKLLVTEFDLQMPSASFEFFTSCSLL